MSAQQVRIELQGLSFRFEKPPDNKIWSVRGAVTDSLRHFQLYKFTVQLDICCLNMFSQLFTC